MKATSPVPVVSKDAPSAIGPYSQGMRVGQLVFCSGQIALDPQGGTMVGETVEQQTEQVMKNIGGLLKSQGLDYGNLIKTTVFLKNMSDFSKFNPIYEKYLRAPFPARSTVEVARLPKEALIEIETIAFIPEA